MPRPGCTGRPWPRQLAWAADSRIVDAPPRGSECAGRAIIEHPKVALGEGEGQGVPVDQPQPVAGDDQVAGVRFAVRDDELLLLRSWQASGQTVQLGQPAGHCLGMADEGMAGRFCERAVRGG
jgi:hypothetical protein